MKEREDVSIVLFWPKKRERERERKAVISAQIVTVLWAGVNCLVTVSRHV